MVNKQSKQKRKPMVRTGAAVFAALFLAALLFAEMPAAYASGSADPYGTEAEWWNFRNSETNNGVTDRKTPTDEKETWEKWSAHFGSGWGASPTSPLILNGKLYVNSGNIVYELDKKTGAILRESEPMPDRPTYAMQSPLYAEGRIFVLISSGRICALNLDDLSLAWTSDNKDIAAGQMNSPLSYVRIGEKGYVYSGSRTTRGGELLCVSADDEGVFENADGEKIKPLTWHFDPQTADAKGQEEHGCRSSGFYWTGAYVSERFLAIGTDNGTLAGDTADDTAFYTLDPQTGAIIDAIYGIKGAVRSTTVYQDGYLYFASKGPVLYKVAVDEEGHLGEPSSIDLGFFEAESTTATPVVYGGKIYLGVYGKGNKYSADGGHGFLAIRNDPVLTQDSFLYKIPVPGYPQMGALLSTAYVNEDYDGDGAPDGRVYLYFTYNAYPGGIFYTWDTPAQTEPTKLSAEEAKIFVPSEDKQQYCISSIAADAQGVLYYKNDSGYFFAVESNPAVLSDMQVLDGEGKEIRLNQDFSPKLADYNATVADETESVQLSLTPGEGVKVFVNEAAYPAGGMTIALAEEETMIGIRTEKAGAARDYHLIIKKEDSNAQLKALASAIGNTAPNVPGAVIRELTPEFNPSATEYTANWFPTGTGRKSDDPAMNLLMNVFLSAESKKAEIAMYPEINIDMTKLNADGTIKHTPIENDLYTDRFAVYSADVTHDSAVRIVVTAQDKKTTQEYRLTFNRRLVANEVVLNETELQMKEGENVILSAAVYPDHATDHSVTWKSSNKSIAKVDQKGTVTAVGAGDAIITASSEDGPYAQCSVHVTAVKKKANPIKVTAKTVTANAKKKTVIPASKAFTIKNAKGKVTYRKRSGNAKITVSSDGTITVRKGLKKGKTYPLKVQVTAAGDAQYKTGSKTVTVKIKVK